MTDKDGGSAFPTELYRDPEGTQVIHVSPGMTLRDWFAGQALAGIATDVSARTYTEDAIMAYHYAEAMLKARKK